MDFNTEEWKTLMEGPDDLKNLTMLGIEVYHDCVREAALDPDTRLDDAVEAMAHVTYHMTEDQDDDLWTDLVFFLQQRWMYEEQTFWESPETLMTANADIERSGKRNAMIELMLIEQALRHRVRPAILRLVWCMMISAGLKRGIDHIAKNDPTGTLLVPTTVLRELVEERAPDFFDEKELAGLQALLDHLRLRENGSTADEVMRAVSCRTFWMIDGGAIMDLYLHREGGSEIGEERIAAWRECAIHLSACMSAFNVMLVGMITAKGIDVRPELFRDKIDQKKKKQPSLTAASP